MDASWKPLKLLSGRFRKKNRASRVEVAASSFPWKTTTTNPTIPTHKKTGENRQTKKRVSGSSQKKKTKKERKKEKGKRKEKEESTIHYLVLQKKKKKEKKGGKKTSLTWSLL
tara:strand:+ start:2985 stop:3323 length:339 start_codon:yes stop_codon:yes gene_type:complete